METLTEDSSTSRKLSEPESLALKKPCQCENQAERSVVARYARTVFQLIRQGLIQESRAVLFYNDDKSIVTQEKNNMALIDGDIEALLEEVCDITVGMQDVFSNLCQLTEVQDGSGSCLSHYFKLQDGKHSLNIGRNEDWSRLCGSIQNRHDDLPPYLWIELTGEKRPFVVPSKDAIFCNETRYELIGFIYSDQDDFFAVVADLNLCWKQCGIDTPMRLVDVARKTSSAAVALMYQAKITKPSSVSIPTTGITLTIEDVEALTKAFDDGLWRSGDTRSRRTGMRLSNYDEPLETLLKSQVAAKLVMNGEIMYENRSQFVLTAEEFKKLYHRISTFNEDTQKNSRLGIYGSNICYFKQGRVRKPLCCRCLGEVVYGILVDNRAYCSVHFPEGSVDYAVYIVFSKTDKTDTFVDWNVSPKEEIYIKPRTGYYVDRLTVEICHSYNEAAVKFHAMTIVYWLKNALEGLPVKIKAMWPTRKFSGFNTDSITDNKYLFRRFKIFGTEECESMKESCSWSREEAIKFGFIFENGTNLLRNVYSILYEKCVSQDMLYIGKNSDKFTEVHERKRRDIDHLKGHQCLALTPNKDMLEYLESVISLACGVGSIMGIRMNASSKNLVLQNYFIPVATRKPAHVKINEYLREIFKHIFNVDLCLESEASCSAEELLRLAGAD